MRTEGSLRRGTGRGGGGELWALVKANRLKFELTFVVCIII